MMTHIFMPQSYHNGYTDTCAVCGRAKYLHIPTAQDLQKAPSAAQRNPLHGELCVCVECGGVPATKPTNPKDAIGSSKPPSSTVSQAVNAEVGLAMLEGSCKYGRHNSRVIGVRSSIYYDAARRHLDKWWEGEDIDPDSGLSHVVKAIASLYVLRDSMIQGNLNDDRPPKTPTEHWTNIERVAKEIIARYQNPVPPFTELNKNDKR